MEDLLRTLIARVPPIRNFVKSSFGQQLVNTLRAIRVIREKPKFLALQSVSPRVAQYRLRGSDVKITVRHHTGDVELINEIFAPPGGRDAYEPPPALSAVLDGGANRKILDLGGNIGLFGAFALRRWPGVSLHSFEPDPENIAILRETIRANGAEERWQATPAAVAASDGELSFVANLLGESHLASMTHLENVRTGPAGSLPRRITVPALDIYTQDHHVDLIKMDIEGGEWSILTDERLPTLGADAIVLEWHLRGCPEQDPRSAAARLLKQAGYANIEDVEVATQCGVFWAWR
jgi:FkbM family methyltransferase